MEVSNKSLPDKNYITSYKYYLGEVEWYCDEDQLPAHIHCSNLSCHWNTLHHNAAAPWQKERNFIS